MSEKKIMKPITDAEWEIMRVAWTKEDITSREVTELLNKKTDWKNTTVKTLLSRLVEKKMLGTKKDGNKFVYFPLIKETESIDTLVTELLDKVCTKKVKTILESAINKSDLSFDDIDDLLELLTEKRKNAVLEVPCTCILGQCQCQ